MLRYIVIVLSVVVVTQLIATPIPKNMETQAAKIKRLFGLVNYEHEECTINLTKHNKLEIEQTKDHPLSSADHSSPVNPPKVYREIDGDCVITIRCKPHLPKNAELNASVAARRNTLGQAAAGLSLHAGNTYVTLVTTLNMGKTRSTGMYWKYSHQGGGGGSSTTGNKLIESPRYIRLTREGMKITGSYSDDGKKFNNFGSCEARQLDEPIRVGPEFFHNTTTTCSAEFDEFTIEPLEKK